MRTHATRIVARPADASSRRRPGAGNPSGVGATFGMRTRPSCSSGRPLRASRRRSRLLRDRRTHRARESLRRRRATSGRHHSAATGGCASAFASATPEALDRLLLGAAPDDRRVRRRPLAEEVTLPALGIEQRHLAFRQRCRERNPRRAAARADVDQRPFEPLDERHGPERVVPQHLPRPRRRRAALSAPASRGRRGGSRQPGRTTT